MIDPGGIFALSFTLIFVCSAWSDELREPEKGKKIKVFILAGQSNMEGRADGNKLTVFPKQNRLLKDHVVSGHFKQGISFATFFGYSHARLRTIMGRLYPFEAQWNIQGPHPVLEGFPMLFVIAVVE